MDSQSQEPNARFVHYTFSLQFSVRVTDIKVRPPHSQKASRPQDYRLSWSAEHFLPGKMALPGLRGVLGDSHKLWRLPSAGSCQRRCPSQVQSQLWRFDHGTMVLRPTHHQLLFIFIRSDAITFEWKNSNEKNKQTNKTSQSRTHKTTLKGYTVMGGNTSRLF